MPLFCSMNCAGVIFDIYDGERVPLGMSKNKYYVTPSLGQNIKAWMAASCVDKVKTFEQMQELIQKGLIGSYPC